MKNIIILVCIMTSPLKTMDRELTFYTNERNEQEFEINWYCGMCAQDITKVSSVRMENELRLHKEFLTHICKDCDGIFDTLLDAKKHYEAHHMQHLIKLIPTEE